MYETELCRLCANVADETKAEKLFDGNHRKLLRQVEELIGQRLKNAEDLPQNICKPCEERTLQAHAFRAQCIRSQQHFALQRKKDNNKQKKRKFKEEAAIDEVHMEEIIINELQPVKVEKVDDEVSPMMHISEVLFKHEFMQSSGDDLREDDESDDSFNPLDEDYHPNHSSDEDGKEADEDIHTIVPPTKPLTEQPAEPPVKPPAEPPTERTEPLLEPSTEPPVHLLDDPETLFKKNKTKTSEIKKKNRGNRTKRGSNEEKPYICDQCGKIFKVNSLLEAHMRRHTGERKFKCEICPDSFFLNSDLKRHMQWHAGALPWACSHCDRRFLDKSHAKKHERTHTNERPYICQQCGKGFTVSHVLKAHMLVHTGERAFSCKMCNAAFKLKKHLVTHYRSLTHKQNEEKHQMNMSNSSQEILTGLG